MAVHQSLARFGIEDRTYSIEEWLAIEERTGEKFEYHHGRLLSVEMMAGGSFAHSQISANAIYALGVAVRNRQAELPALPFCGVHTSDLKLLINNNGRYVYPDAAVICGKPEFDARVPTAARTPVLVVEVLSPTSVGYDTGEKFAYYAALPSLRDYMLITQDEPWVEIRSRTEAGGAWTFAFAKTLDERIALPSLAVELPMAEVYRGVDFESESPPAEDENPVEA